MLNHIESGIRERVAGFQARKAEMQATDKVQQPPTIEESRAGYLAGAPLAGPSPEMAQEYLDSFAGVQVKVYKPSEEQDLPITVYFHGGCFISGGYATHQQQLRELAKSGNSIVICILYRLAPEHTYPTAHDDVYQAVLAIKQNGGKLGGNTDSISFVGDSAGGHLALMTSLRLRDNQCWLPKQQVLLYPMLDPKGSSESYKQNGSDYIVTAQMLLSGFELYFQQEINNSENPEVYPLVINDFKGLPTTHIVTAEFDPLRDEGEQLYRHLLESGVEAYCQRYMGVTHGFAQLSAISLSAVQCLQSISNLIKGKN